MKNLIILGNGFDLAHDLKTGYGDFIHHIFDQHIKDRTTYPDLLNLPTSYLSLNMLLTFMKTMHVGTNTLKSPFLLNLLKMKADTGNWADIESVYFEMLNEKNCSPKELNADFENLKNALQEYLQEQQPKATENLVYRQVFENLTIHSDKTLVLSFNYTDTFERLYLPHLQNSEVRYIHGKLFDPMNPIIFGYAANDEEINALIDKGENAYLKNIKRHCYKRTSNERIVKEFLGEKVVGNKKSKVNVYVLGHSCSLSDKLILSEIMNHDNVESISIMYYETADAYFDSHINLYRIMRNNVNYDKIVNFQESCRMPQLNDSAEQSQKIFHWSDGVSEHLARFRNTNGGISRLTF